MKYFLFNKESDYTRGYLQNMIVEQGGIRAGALSGQRAVFFSRLLDGRESEMNWHRLRISAGRDGKWAFCLSVYAGNQRNFLYRGKEIDLEEFICRSDIAVEEKKEHIVPWLQKQVMGKRDVLLHEVKGRYLWLLIEMYQDGGGLLSDIQIFFPRQSWMDYLPEIYTKEDKDSFLERFLAIFQTIYEDFGAGLGRISDYFDSESAKGNYLTGLAEWLAVREPHIWSDEQLRKLLRGALSLYRRRGTRQGVMDFVELYTGERPFIVEYHEVHSFPEEAGRIEILYGRDCYSFTVLVREQVAGTVWQQKTLQKIINDVKPAQLECHLVILKPYLFLGQYTYLGVNSILGSYTGMVLDGHTAIPFAYVT